MKYHNKKLTFNEVEGSTIPCTREIEALQKCEVFFYSKF